MDFVLNKSDTNKIKNIIMLLKFPINLIINKYTNCIVNLDKYIINKVTIPISIVALIRKE